MGVLNTIKIQWKGMTTAEKIGTVLDIICGIGGSSAAGIAAKELVKRTNSRIDKICIPVAMCGIGWHIGAIAKNSLMENIGLPVANMVDKAKEKNKEEQSDE